METVHIELEEREQNLDVEEREKERERGSNLRRQRLASPTAQVLVAQTTQPVQRIGFVTSFRATFGLTRSIGGWFSSLPFSSSIPVLALSLFLQHIELVFHKLCLIITHWFLVRFSSNFQEKLLMPSSYLNFLFVWLFLV